jgi:hypothetical protein
VTRRPGDGPEDVDAAFAEIVASLEREGLGASVMEEDERGKKAPGRADQDTFPDAIADPDTTAGPVSPTMEKEVGKPAGWRTPDAEWDPDAIEEEEHFVPPDPPPLPRLRPGTLFGILLMAVGVVLLAAPTAIGLAPRVATPLALVAMAAGIGWLVLRMRQGPPPDSGWDDGAQL